MTAVACRNAVACGEALLAQVACRDAMLAQLWIQRCRLSLVIVQNDSKFGDKTVTTNTCAVCNAAKNACAMMAYEHRLCHSVIMRGLFEAELKRGWRRRGRKQKRAQDSGKARKRKSGLSFGFSQL